jgi:LCP family protein required for cell wall assembly
MVFFMLKRTMPRKIFIAAIILEVIFGGLALVYISSAFWHRPLGVALGMPTQVGEQSNYSARLSNQAELSSGSLPQSTPTSASLLGRITRFFKHPDSTSASLCGGPSVMTILVVGSDERANDYLYGLADSIRIVRIDFTIPEVMILDIPRDLWVDIPDIADHYGIKQGKLNQAYFFGNPGMGYYDGPGEGPGLLARTLDLNYGLQVDHYLALDRKTFVDVINTIGGIDVQVSERIDINPGQDAANPDLVLQPGTHHLDGDQALKLAVDRNPSIFQRAKYQNIILKTLQAQLLSPAMIPSLPKLVAQFAGSVQTDLSPSDISQLICIGQKLSQENVEMVAFPESMFTSGSTYDPYRQVNTFTLSVDITSFREYISDFTAGTWPQE